MKIGAIPADLAGQIDLLGELRRRIAEFRPVVDQEKALAKLLLARADNWKPEQEGQDKSALCLMRNSMRSEKQLVKSYLKIFRWLKQAKFLELCSITFEALKANLTAEQYAAVVEKQRTGNRKLELVLRVAATAPAVCSKSAA